MLFDFLYRIFTGKIRKKHILDKDGMINGFSWISFSVSRVGSVAQYNFSITVVNHHKKYEVVGTLRDAEGNFYDEKRIVLPFGVSEKIKNLHPETLPDVKPQDKHNISDEETDLFNSEFILDADSSEVVVEYSDGEKCKKVDVDDFSLSIYNLVMPHFKK
jgi:hypothetical protein